MLAKARQHAFTIIRWWKQSFGMAWLAWVQPGQVTILSLYGLVQTTWLFFHICPRHFGDLRQKSLNGHRICHHAPPDVSNSLSSSEMHLDYFVSYTLTICTCSWSTLEDECKMGNENIVKWEHSRMNVNKNRSCSVSSTVTVIFWKYLIVIKRHFYIILPSMWYLLQFL